MKLSHAGACAFAISFAVQAQPGPSLSADTHRPSETSPSHTISIELLRQPLSRKAKQILVKAQHASDAGDHATAIGLLEAAHLKYPESDAWTQSLLGVEYLKTLQLAAAVRALEEAVRLLPRDAADRSNLGLALAATGEYDRAELELRSALVLGHGNPTTRRLLDVVLVDKVRKLPNQSAVPPHRTFLLLPSQTHADL